MSSQLFGEGYKTKRGNVRGCRGMNGKQKNRDWKGMLKYFDQVEKNEEGLNLITNAWIKREWDYLLDLSTTHLTPR